MRSAVRHDVWLQAQSGHLETWQTFASLGKRSSPEREARWKSVIAEVEARDPIRDDEVVLDIGCGLDSVLDYMPRVRGVTLDSLMAKLRPLGLSAEIEHAAGVFEGMPFRDGSFDRCFLMNVLDHVRDPEIGLAEIARVLRRGGVLVLSVDTYSGRRYWEKRARKWWDRKRGARTKHPWVFSVDDVAAALRRTGFEPGTPTHTAGSKARRTFLTARKR